ncbi:MAG: CoA-binding protein [Bacteroidales bacterium]
MKTLVIGASPNPLRYSHKAIKRLRKHDIPVVAIGKRETTVADVAVIKDKPAMTDIHTVTLYVGPDNQEGYEDYIISLKPERIIFNPGTYNRRLDEKAEKAGIETVEDCTLIMLDSGFY